MRSSHSKVSIAVAVLVTGTLPASAGHVFLWKANSNDPPPNYTLPLSRGDIEQVAIAGSVRLALTSNGFVWNWTDSFVGTGITPLPVFNPQNGVPSGKVIAAGMNSANGSTFGAAVLANTSVHTWGTVPPPSGGLTAGYRTISSGPQHIHALRYDGIVHSLGSIDFTSQITSVPVDVPGGGASLEYKEVKAWEKGGIGIVAEEGGLELWGVEWMGQSAFSSWFPAPSGTGFTSAAASRNYTVAVSADGSLKAWMKCADLYPQTVNNQIAIVCEDTPDDRDCTTLAETTGPNSVDPSDCPPPADFKVPQGNDFARVEASPSSDVFAALRQDGSLVIFGGNAALNQAVIPPGIAFTDVALYQNIVVAVASGSTMDCPCPVAPPDLATQAILPDVTGTWFDSGTQVSLTLLQASGGRVFGFADSPSSTQPTSVCGEIRGKTRVIDGVSHLDVTLRLTTSDGSSWRSTLLAPKGGPIVSGEPVDEWTGTWVSNESQMGNSTLVRGS